MMRVLNIHSNYKYTQILSIGSACTRLTRTQQAARHPHLELRAVAIRLVGALGATMFMNDWPTCLHATLAELSATPQESLVLDAVLRAWLSLAANDAITWSEVRSRDLVSLASHAWLHASHFVSVTCQ